jgi:hypothetical protein
MAMTPFRLELQCRRGAPFEQGRIKACQFSAI